MIGRVLGMTCGGATIVPDYEALEAGHAVTNVDQSISDWDARGRWRWVSMFRARIIVLMAGRESETEIFGKDPDAQFGDAYDLREIDRSLDEANIDGSRTRQMADEDTRSGTATSSCHH